MKRRNQKARRRAALGQLNEKTATSGSLSTIALTRQVVPDKCRVVLPYWDYYIYGVQLSTAFPRLRVNSTFAPVDAGFVRNAQPNGRDQWVTFYNRYIVHRFRIRAQTAMDSPDANVVMVSSWYGNNIPAAGSQVGFESSQIPLPQGVISKYTDAFRLDTGWVSLAQLNGRSDVEYRSNDTFFGAAVGATPTAADYFGILVSELNNLASAGFVIIQMEQDVEFYDRLSLASS